MDLIGFYNRSLTYLTQSVGITAALVWVSVVVSVKDYYFPPQPAEGLLYEFILPKLLPAILLTLLVAFTFAYIKSRVNNIGYQPRNQLVTVYY